MISAWVVALAAACTAAPDADVDAFFKEFAAKRDGIVALDAAFTQSTKLPDEELTTKGDLIFIKPRRIIFHTEDPDQTTLVDDRRGYEYDPEIKQLQIFDIEDNPQADIFFLGFNSNPETLRQAYDLSLFDVIGDPRGTHGLKIKPRADSKEHAYFIEVDLYLRDEDFLPYRIHIQNDQESQVNIEVASIDKSFRPTQQLTQIFLPEDTKVVENDRVVETIGPGGKRVPDAMLLPPEPEKPKPEPVPPLEPRVAPARKKPITEPNSEPAPVPPVVPKAEPAPQSAPEPGTEPDASGTGKDSAPDSGMKSGPKTVKGRKAKDAQ